MALPLSLDRLCGETDVVGVDPDMPLSLSIDAMMRECYDNHNNGEYARLRKLAQYELRRINPTPIPHVVIRAYRCWCGEEKEIEL